MNFEHSGLDLSSLKKAIKSLESALDVYEKFSADKNITSDVIDTLRAGVIQNFEFSYELSWKMMKRWLDENRNPDMTFGASKKELFRLAAENGLISDVSKWFAFQMSRNRTSHTYDENVALEVAEIAKQFLPYAKQLYKRLEQSL